MKLLSLALIVFLSVSVASCSTQTPAQPPAPVPIAYDAPEGATQSELLTVRFECWKETATSAGGGGLFESELLPNCSAFAACMAARGYIRNPQGSLVVPESAKLDCRR